MSDKQKAMAWLVHVGYLLSFARLQKLTMNVAICSAENNRKDARNKDARQPSQMLHEQV